MDLGQILNSLAGSYVEAQKIKEFGPGYQQKLDYQTAQAKGADLENAISQMKLQELQTGNAAERDLARAAHPDKSPDEALAAYRSERLAKKTRLEDEIAESQVLQNQAPFIHAMNPTPRGMQHVTTADGVHTFDPTTGTLGAKIGDAPKPPATVLNLPGVGVYGIDRRTLKAQPVQVGASDTPPSDNPPAANTPGGQLAGIPVGAQDRIRSAAVAGKVLSRIEGLAAKLQVGEGVRGKLTATGRSYAGRAGADPDFELFRTSVRGLAPLLARAVGHTGVLTEQDVQRTEDLLGVNDPDSVRASKLANFRNLMSQITTMNRTGKLDELFPEDLGFGDRLDVLSMDAGAGAPPTAPVAPGRPAPHPTPTPAPGGPQGSTFSFTDAQGVKHTGVPFSQLPPEYQAKVRARGLGGI